jgi:hypothetical protein
MNLWPRRSVSAVDRSFNRRLLKNKQKRSIKKTNLVSQLFHKVAALGRIHPVKEPVSSG